MLTQIKAEGGDVKLLQISREENKKADSLANVAVVDEQHFSQPIPLEEIAFPTIDKEKEVLPIKIGETWITPIFYYLDQGTLLEDQLKAKIIVQRSVRYNIPDGCLYRRSYIQPWLKCIKKEDRLLILLEIHEGLCDV
ncbi:hypothetical protein P3X46_013724 [Hevea brasiliensis]|uniref:RNase H type-1 domain-containing protein n=1 Tax=Hevea brasiliensis TaxID=3981 RepID=A0ABQ9M5I7_HEVBR|nr:hypothetical protein P3X46_013724 [Hevea brasiliensis]